MSFIFTGLDSAAEAAVITGDPERVEYLVKAAGSVTNMWRLPRGYVCAEVVENDVPVLMCSHGIGGPSAAIVVEELSRCGISRIVRVGTCGSMQPAVRSGDLVISTGCIRDEGTSHQYLPAEFPAVPDFSVLAALIAAAEEEGIPAHVGMTHCKDAYYAEKPEGFPLADTWQSRWAAYRAAGVLATEMEAATLFAVASVRRIRAGAVFVPVDDVRTPDRMLGALQGAARVALHAVRSLG
ncbi:MAG TPA: nucleoside phosphorylase [Actinophytocola sp.]|uniref:nucleoside phosphorylase n=1 Tax=Actinophytocola sp. TaxID=1872138 RepID=UPI002DDDA103|nr:nucleoside phosphorylase [Actinophytocola sp.]HEV2778225.1 nucleoside phosphorylase [Actinophytocola sp.]